jgi:hypothetical protein
MKTQTLAFRSTSLSIAAGLVVGLSFFLLAGFTEIQSRLSESQAAISPFGEISLTTSKVPYLLSASLTACVFVACVVALLRAIEHQPARAAAGSASALSVVIVLGSIGGLHDVPTRVTLREALPWGVLDVLYAAAGSTVIYIAAATCIAGMLRGALKHRQRRVADAQIASAK